MRKINFSVFETTSATVVDGDRDKDDVKMAEREAQKSP